MKNMRLNPHLFNLPVFSTSAFIHACLLFLLPNIFFLVLAAYLSAARPIINLDYILPSLLLLTPKRWLRILSLPAYFLTVAGDAMMLIMQLFPFMDLKGAIYLAPFALTAPLIYQLFLAAILLYALILPWLLNRWPARASNLYHGILAGLLLVSCAHFTSHLQYHNRHIQDTLFGRNNFYYARSQWALYQAVHHSGFIQAHNTRPTLTPYQGTRAAALLTPSPPEKILFIIVESWGVAQHQALNEVPLSSLKNLHRKGILENWQQGDFPFDGATVAAEMRELCALSISGFALRHAPEGSLDNCLPMQLQKQGYATESLHGASGLLYDRNDWYRAAGLKSQYFPESPELINLKRCSVFNGVCDSELFQLVSRRFAQPGKRFFYWLTLTSHSPYPQRDIRQPSRLDCPSYRLPADTMLCRNYQLHSQFFDQLAEMLSQPQMAGTQVLLVGDHAPPTTDLGEGFKYLNGNHIPYLAFTVRNPTAGQNRNQP